MRILFDLRSTGLGNNGGSQTIVRSANTLIDLNQEVIFLDSMKNMYTWDKLEAKHIVVKREKDIPNADAVIATGFKSVRNTLNLPKRCGKKFHWIRAWEHWQMSDKEIVEKILNVPTIKLVNSICLQEKLLQYRCSSFIIRPGYDFEDYFPLNLEKKNSNIILGALYREGVHGNRKRTTWNFIVAREIKKLYPSMIKLWMFGSEKKPNSPFLDNYLRSPVKQQKNEFYNMIDIWMAPTMSEGLHLPPAEAMMTGCPVVTTNAPLSGTQDYTIHLETGLVSDNNLESFKDSVNELVQNPVLRKNLSFNCRKKIESLGNRKTNMFNLINLIKETCNVK